jgi:NAD(P)-dependent dehydrogenase (short-subunit alcohol dehydrogenase family)
MMAVNVRAPWMCARTLGPLLADGATVIVTASVSSFVQFPREGVYCMTKAALIPMVRDLALEFADRGIRVNALCPGIVAEQGM